MNTLHITRGDSYYFRVALEKPDGNQRRFRKGDKVYFTVRKSVSKSEPVLSKEVEEFEDGYAYITIDPDDTNDLKFGCYHYDVQVKFARGIIKTIIRPSRFIVGGEVTYG